jgi:hypothetical protein
LNLSSAQSSLSFLFHVILQKLHVHLILTKRQLQCLCAFASLKERIRIEGMNPLQNLKGSQALISYELLIPSDEKSTIFKVP